jgi:hypothetical protein
LFLVVYSGVNLHPAFYLYLHYMKPTTDLIGAALLAAALITPPEKKRGSSRNRQAGHGYELEERDFFREIGYPHLTTSRAESRNRDNQQIDLTNVDEHINGRFPFNVQCKCISSHVGYHDILAGYWTSVKIKKGPDAGKKTKKWVAPIPRVPGVINVVLHKFTEKEIQSVKKGANKGSSREVFLPKGYYAIMTRDDFRLLVKERLEMQAKIKLLETQLYSAVSMTVKSGPL